jgi:PD-(D/E)XK endonuclease
VNFDHAAPFGAAFFIGLKIFMKITGASIKLPKQRGEWAELRFMARAAEHGLSISKPWGDSCRYDFIVEHAGKFLRVQVKSTVCQKRKSWAYHVNGRPYASGEIDFFAIYIIPKNIWYIFPADVISKFTRNMILSPHMKVSKHGVYKEAWHLLRGGEVSQPAAVVKTGTQVLSRTT